MLDIIDPKSQRSVWRSAHPLGFKEKDNSRELKTKISKAINNMLRDYPRDNKSGLGAARKQVAS